MKYNNDLEIRVFGLRRSGNHAIINWIAAQAPKQVHFFNCCCRKGRDPMKFCKTRGDRKNTNIANIFYPHPKYKKARPEKLKVAKEMHKEVLMYSYENLSLEVLRKHEMPLNREATLGKSKRRVDILLLRDLPNWLASKLIVRGRADFSDPRFHSPRKLRKMEKYFKKYKNWQKDAIHIGGKDYNNVEKHILMWCDYALEYLKIKERLEEPININYNAWHVSKNYRKSIIEQLGFDFTDKGKEVVAAIAGKGSSFDDLDYDGKAEQMKVLDRWKTLKNNRLFMDIFKAYPQAIRLSNYIFGRIIYI